MIEAGCQCDFFSRFYPEITFHKKQVRDELEANKSYSPQGDKPDILSNSFSFRIFKR